MELINYKSVDHENIFSFNDLVDFDLVLNAFQDKIIQLKENSLNSKKIKCIIDLGKRKICGNELLNLFDIILNEEFILIDKIYIAELFSYEADLVWPMSIILTQV